MAGRKTINKGRLTIVDKLPKELAERTQGQSLGKVIPNKVLRPSDRDYQIEQKIELKKENHRKEVTSESLIMTL